MGPDITHHQDEACMGSQVEISQGPTEGRGGNCSHNAVIPNELQLMATITSSSEAVHLRVESSQAVSGLPPCYLDTEQKIMGRVDSTISSVFDEHMRQFAEQSHLLYTSMPPMMDIVRAAMAAIPSRTSSSMAAAAGTLDAKVSSCTRPPPLLMPGLQALLIFPSFSSPLVILGMRGCLIPIHFMFL
ncbi:hypothetical protein M9H77_06796 [Catharanthus roseus]|uniref:Uncharacterized protein n=1 Tax=Catharanthus roseus TaxID=4058 RepID=A0ACC0BT71_CATRO|nr:hypothetical protein M9H77_06796 [Catharanthus roseus]